MPIFNPEEMNTRAIGGTNFKYSAVRIEDLGATEYTLVGLTVDVSSSVTYFAKKIEACVKETVKSCRLSPRSDNLMLRFVTFNRDVEEQHGYRQLQECDVDKYTGSIAPSGTTACYDACVSQLGAMADYAKTLFDAEYQANGILVVITDGEDNSSRFDAKAVAARMDEIRKSEHLESLLSILVGVNVNDTDVSRYLKHFETEGKFDKYVEIDNANASSLAKLAEYVSKSVSAQSQALGTGGPSQALSF
jgi:hypothetical protein